MTRSERVRSGTRADRLRQHSVPMRLYREAKQRGGWDPRALDLSQDARDWARLTVAERDMLLRLTALFHVAEESMTRDLLPLLMTVVRENRPEEELFLTTFLSDEAEHTEFFRRILQEVCRHSGDLLRYQTPSFHKLFSEKLPAAMRALLADASAAAQAEAVVTYTLVGEGVLGEAGHHVFATALEGAARMPGFRTGLARAQADEERHMAYGLFVLSRLVGETPAVWDVISRRMEALLPDTLGVVNEFFEPYDPMPFGLSLEATIAYTMARFAGRWASLEQTRERRRGARRGRGADETVRGLVAWIREQAQVAAVEVRPAGTIPIYTFRVSGEPPSVLLVTQDVLDHYTSGEIITALSGRGVAQRLRDHTGLLVTCLTAGGRIVVQAPSA
jgi:ribonucleoside-diphosphate reductase beta chain